MSILFVSIGKHCKDSWLHQIKQISKGKYTLIQQILTIWFPNRLYLIKTKVIIACIAFNRKKKQRVRRRKEKEKDAGPYTHPNKACFRG